MSASADLSPKLRIVSWILLALVGTLTLVGAVASVGVAYFSEDDPIGPVSLSELTADRPEAGTALRARRGTAAAFAAGYGLLFLIITLLPYRRGEVWAWWTLLAAATLVNGVILLRLPLLGTELGLGTALLGFGVSALALFLDASRLKRA